MLIRLIAPVLIVVAAPFARAEKAPVYERIVFPTANGRQVMLYALNDRGEVLGTDCDITTTPWNCDLFLWTENHGRRTIRAATSGLEKFFLNNHGHVAVNRNWWPVSNQRTVEFWSEQTGWQTVPQMSNISFFNDRDMIYGSLTMGASGLWDGHEFYPVLVPPGTAQWYATQMNNDGMLVGAIQLPPCGAFQCQHPFTWTNKTGVVDLGVLPDLPSGQPYALNDDGNVAGILYDGSLSTTRHIFLWTPKVGMLEVGACPGCSAPTALNKHEEIAGNVYYGVSIRTYFWNRSTGFIDIGTLGGSSARVTGMNDRAQIVGESSNSNGTWRAFVWSQKAGFIDLTPSGWGVATGINNDGLITGSSEAGPCVWIPR
jgi:probable HAF family extracellular repeat protein